MGTEKTESPSLRLAQYLKEFVSLRSATIRDVDKYESVVWFGDLPQETGCSSGAWSDDCDPQGPWLEVHKQQFKSPPEPPELTAKWVDKRALGKATTEIPPLRASIFVEDTDAELDEGETPPLVERHLSEHPEVVDAYEAFRPKWEAWSEDHRRRDAIQKAYAELFGLHNQLQKRGEIVEVVLGLGLVDWRAKIGERSIPIRRHAVVGQVELTFDPEKGVIRVGASGDGARLRIEDDMFEAELRPDRAHYAAVEAQLDELGDAIWDKSLMHAALKIWSGALSADSTWFEGLRCAPSNGKNPVVSFAPALILRTRLQTGMVRVYEKLIEQLGNGEDAVPAGWGGLTDDDWRGPADPTFAPPDPGREGGVAAPPAPETYFPLPANREQRRIVEALNHNQGVLVQGPPGTGKSHTIANLMCHLLATGKRVLITAETGRALQVLKDKLPEEIQPLCVSLLGQGGDAFAELNTAVQGITNQHSSYSPGAYDDRIAEIDRELDEARRDLAEIDSEIRSLREDETRPHSLLDGKYQGTAARIAARVANERARCDWLELSAEAGGQPPISNGEAARWLEIRRGYSEEEVKASTRQIPDSASLPTPKDFAALVSSEASLRARSEEVEALRSHRAFRTIRALSADAWNHLKQVLRSTEERRLARKVASCVQELTALRELHDVHPVVHELFDSVDSVDARSYSEGHARLVGIEQTREAQATRLRIEAGMERAAPGLVAQVEGSLDDPIWEDRLSAWEEAWCWAVTNAWLERRSDLDYQQKLWRKRHDAEASIGQLIAEAASLRAWRHFFDRLSAREANALRSWREAVRAMGKGTGKSARLARLRGEARRYMDARRDAIPIWIMPRYLVAEMVDPVPDRYDLVIVDEASQLGIESLFLFYIAKKIIVVGDDQQISPAGVGIADNAVASLQQNFLDGAPHQHALSPQSSLYGNAKIRFNQNIVLREHFRCMPEIIQFSNDLCYASNGTPLDPLRAYGANRIEPLLLRHVPDGYRKGTEYAQNPPEAEAIVAQICACIDDPRYAGATMGVISLQGEAQAKLIENMLLGTLDPAVIEERRLICGDAYAFQGDERNVIFLSMVAAPGDHRIGALTNEAARQRFNVAVSRAQDQLWLFHTAGLDSLSTACMRHRLLSYMLDPRRKATAEDEQRFDSEFERHVYQRITDRGFHVRTQVCVGDPTNHRYRIDLVVEGMQGRLAVECDGDEWHGPDRYEQDMARQRDLERAGWQFARIRGGDFYRDPEEAMGPIWLELQRLGIEPGGIDASAAQPPPSKPIDLQDRLDTAEHEPTLGATQPPEHVERPHEATGSVPSIQPEKPELPAGSTAGEEGLPLSQGGALPSTNSGTAAPYVVFEGQAGPDPRGSNAAQVAEGLCRIIDREGPVVAKRAYDLYLRGSDIRKMGGGLKRSLNEALQHAIRTGRVVTEDESGNGGLVYSVVRLTGAPAVVLRERGPREFAEIPPSELQLVARRLSRDKGFELGSDVHLRAVLEFFDLKRLTVQVGTTLLDVLARRYSYVEEILRSEGGQP